MEKVPAHCPRWWLEATQRPTPSAQYPGLQTQWSSIHSEGPRLASVHAAMQPSLGLVTLFKQVEPAHLVNVVPRVSMHQNLRRWPTEVHIALKQAQRFGPDRHSQKTFPHLLLQGLEHSDAEPTQAAANKGQRTPAGFHQP
eukprot:CAMPEP_0204479244 /NCGR_PEP_ID=MMETSP0471-20130131/33956_1 /ASSEMBLY_ACC=CAM_ASM_000602 /TAXON_ID=2969 /ORGANISM="Oxyrrhis marina" /LENGTH=140 /DNA_ID=CAMNT_0051482149 /DNA_START=743 /DNA_END=1161 /DNA_ORIENTATION=+